MHSSREYFLSVLGVDQNYATLSANNVLIRRKNERTPFAEIVNVKGQTVLRVGPDIQDDSAIKIVLDDY